MFLLVYSEADVVCDVRAQVAWEMINSDEAGLEINTAKTVRQHRAALVHAANTGKLGRELFCALRLAGRVIKADVQFNEGINSLLKVEINKAPSMTMELLDARARLKFTLGYLDLGMKWHQRKKTAALLAGSLNRHATIANDVCSASAVRYAPP
eukprot:4487594-Pyramimonas_sp.AAC.1